ncbi:DNA polymerase/3'-5' exonuclease PolX [Caldimonas sp. KR1-144]|uniref:DNA polymerase/3'-5' exonuclease PolX n=1 Tax=Caldimonas sp. KR1-144 TaxID=3400911 RepID=UPI003C10C538
MPATNAEIAAVFDRIADLLELQDANAFRVRAYRRAARMLEGLGRSVAAMAERGEDLDALPGIGPDLAGKIAEIAASGTCALHERLRAEMPPQIAELLALPGLGARRVRALHDELGITSLAELHRAAQDGRVQTVHGFGEKTERRLLEACAAHLREGRRILLAQADVIALGLLERLGKAPGVRQAFAAGSLRRRRETVGDIDLLVTMRSGSPVMQRFTGAPAVQRVLSRGATRASVVLDSGLQVDLRAVAPASLGAAWLYFTGSKAHGIALRKRAQALGLKLNEYGLYRGRRRIAGATEASIYEALGLDYIEPELREDTGEIEAARRHRLPALVRVGDLRGDLHVHTRDSDGADDLETMAEAARTRGLQYLAITDHSRGSGLPRSLDAPALARQVERIEALNARLEGITLLKGVEVEILEDGRLDLPDALLGRLDLVIGAVHRHLDLPRARQTDRLLRAMAHPCFSILAHPLTRLIGERPACDIDLPRVLRAARERGCFVELNAQPSRLDLPDSALRIARDEGVLVSIASDAHAAGELDVLRLGVDQARRGWLSAADVLNARTLAELRALLDPTMGRSRSKSVRDPSATPAFTGATP